MPPLVAPLVGGQIDIVGDVHGELDVLRELMGRLGYDAQGHHPDGRKLVFLGDLCDRGPDSPGVIDLVWSMIDAGRAQCILGNHELNVLRRDKKDGNAWYFGQEHPHHEEEERHARSAPEGNRYRDFFQSLPLVLERGDLRLVHAAWESSAVNALRGVGGTPNGVCDHHGVGTDRNLDESGLGTRAKAEKDAYRAALKDGATEPPLLEDLGRYEELKQSMNPVRVLTSGPERLASRPFFTNHKWQLCERVKWWDEYTDDVHVIVGHYWRSAGNSQRGTETSLSGGKPDMFAEHAPHSWVGARKNVFCVDFSIGGRHKERARNATSYQTQLAAVRWPEQQLMFADGQTFTMTAAGAESA